MIQTQRLLLMPLTYEQLVKYIRQDSSLETELRLNPTIRSISPDLQEALEQTILPNVADNTKNYLFSTLWTLVLKKTNQMVGDLCFMGGPNTAGEIELGYGTYDHFIGQGYMTEAVAGMVKWAMQQPNVSIIVANTDKGNTASHKILQKNGFEQYAETETQYYWKHNNQ